MQRQATAIFLLLLVGACTTTAKQGVAVGPGLDGIGPPRARVPRRPLIDVEHYALDLELHPEERSLRGTCAVRFRANSRIDDVRLDLRELEVSAVQGSAGEELAFEHFNGELIITLARALAAGETGEVVIDYGGEPRKGLWFAGGRRVPTHVFTQGECEDSHWWFPCWDSPADRATSEIRVTMPAGWTSVAAGERVSSTTSGAARIDHWRMVTPHPTYLTTLVAGDLTVLESDWEGVPLYYLAPDRFASSLSTALSKTPDALTFLSQVTGKRYPYSKYSTACVEGLPFGGMENVSATTLTVAALKDERARLDDDPTGLIVHAAAHQWFGDLLTCERWSDIWLNEGFATYMTSMYFESREGVDAFRVRMRETRDTYLDKDKAAGGRRPVVHDVYHDPLDLFFSGHAYQGGATRLHLLRSVLGDEAFLRGVRRYVGENQGTAVLTADLRDAMEAASGRDLEGFFQQWIHSPGFPEFKVRWRWDADEKRVLLTVNQVQAVEDGTPEVFELPVDVEVRGEKARMHRVEVNQRRHLFELPCESEPLWVRFDKFGWVPGTVQSVKLADEWLAIVAGDDDVCGRLDALIAIGKLLEHEEDNGERARLRHAVISRLGGDAIGAVRVGAARVLGAIGGTEARHSLVFAARSDEDPDVREAALAALENWGSDAELAELAKEVFTAGYTYRTMGAAAGLLGSADPQDAFAWLMAQGVEDTLQGDFQRALLPQLARINDPGVVNELRRVGLDRSAPDLARADAVRLLAQVAPRDAQVRKELVGLLESSSANVRRAAVTALAAIADEPSLAALEAHYPTSVSSQERRSIETAFGL